MRSIRPTRRRAAAALCGLLAPALSGTNALAAQQPANWSITLCVLQKGELHDVQARVDPVRGDTTVNGVPFSQAYPSTGEYAAGESWYVDHEYVQFDDRPFVPLGLPRVLEPRDLVRFGEFEGVPLFKEAGENRRPDVIYVPERPGCVFQPYQVSYPDLVRTGGRDDWPWPSPRPTAQLQITDLVLPRSGPLPTFQQVADRLEVALTRSGYERMWFYAVPGGFAILLPFEQFRGAGAPASRNRFPAGGFPVPAGSVKEMAHEIANALEGGVRGHYRIMAVLVTPYPLTGGAGSLTRTERAWWKYNAGWDLPIHVAERRLRPDHQVTVLVYEYERASDGAPLQWRAEPRASVEAHLRATGMWSQLDRHP